MIDPSESPESLRYRMLGADSSSDLEKLEKYTGDVDWSYLKPHFDAGVLLYVDPSLKLVDVGRAFSDDAKDAVQEWLKKGDIIKPSEPHAGYWEQTSARFTALVVSPFVLIQQIE